MESQDRTASVFRDLVNRTVMQILQWSDILFDWPEVATMVQGVINDLSRVGCFFPFDNASVLLVKGPNCGGMSRSECQGILKSPPCKNHINRTGDMPL